MRSLLPCGSCGRHVRSSARCPFCDAPGLARPGRLAPALVLAATSLVAVTARADAADSEEAGAVNDAGDDETDAGDEPDPVGRTAAVYGAPGCDLAAVGDAELPSALGALALVAAAVATRRKGRGAQD